MKKTLSLSQLTKVIKFALVSIGTLVSNDINPELLKRTPGYSVNQSCFEFCEDSKIYAELNKILQVMLEVIPSFTSFVKDLQENGSPYIFAEILPVSEIEDFHNSLLELEFQLSELEQQSDPESSEVAKMLRGFSSALKSLYQDIFMYAYKKEADNAILSRFNSEISDSFDETSSREDIRRVLLG